MKKLTGLGIAALLFATSANAQDIPMSQKMAATVMKVWPTDTSSIVGKPFKKWNYDEGVVLKGMEGVWQQTADRTYFKYIQQSMDNLVSKDGSTITGYKADDYTLDNILCGRNLLMLYNVTGSEKYFKAATMLYDQLKKQPRTPEGGFWHKKRYPDQMWLDGLYMGESFYAEYAGMMHKEADFDDIANQFILMEKHARDAKTGLLYHGWDYSKKERWANPQTGLSQEFWGRADGWYAMALVDVLDYFPQDHLKRPELIAILNRLATAITKYQDPKTGVWYDILDKPEGKGNYLEASASSMFTYALAKGVRNGYLAESYLPVAEKAYKGLLTQFITTDASGAVTLKGTVSVSGLGGQPYRDGTYGYYLSEKVVDNDPKGVGAFLQASVEIERLANRDLGKGKTVIVDSYFNDEHRVDKITGDQNLSYHYKWEEEDNNGFSFFANAFHNYGVKTETLYQAPTAENLKKASIYIIVDPDIPKENPNTKYIEAPHIQAISDWVKGGGTLIVLNNDTGNAEFKHLNMLLAKFGIHDNEDSRNHVVTPHFETGAVIVPATDPIFKTAKKVYIKEISTFAVTPPAVASLVDNKDILIATAKYGKGKVFVVGDPWFYNEYTDGRKLPADYDNLKAANDLIKWALK
ncbi:glycoside hydrolase family 88 protein [uncultured Mucilaginibacter sp.]|uniref:glycoside hydrolase family 88/105 protein n=1 Tax=uncultured Mucilaginibacter sp. TaxID=797541 RepID=UPI0025F46C60|nr:glycoside hydrolase family 88 protein [uncultured Mucilaginibacter sp.]